MDAHQQALQASAPVAVLEPIYNEFEEDENEEYDDEDFREILRDGVEKRRPLYLTRDMYLKLGRSSITGIADPILSRQLCRIRKNPRNSFWFEILKPNHSVYINGQPATEREVKLYDRFVISLFHHKYAYRFRVLIKESRPKDCARAASPDCPDTEQASATATVATTTTPGDSSSSISQEVECAICLDVMVKTTSLRCGHCFCQECIEGRTDCPTCREQCGEIRIPIKTLDGVIYKLMLNGDHFDKEDVDVYLERTGLPPPKKRSATEIADDAASKRQRLVFPCMNPVMMAPPPQPQITLLSTQKEFDVAGGGSSRDTAICLE